MTSLPRWLDALRGALLLWALVLCMGAAFARGAAAANVGDDATCGCCAGVCHCTPRGNPSQCHCGAAPSAPQAPAVPAPELPRLPPAPACAALTIDIPFVVTQSAPAACACPRAPPRGDRDVCQGRRRHSVLSVWRL